MRQSARRKTTGFRLPAFGAFRLTQITFRQVLWAVLILIQFPLWFGQGGWLQVWRLERQLEREQVQVQRQRELIEELEAEVRDLRTGTMAAEERARYELGLMRPGERFVQVIKPGDQVVPEPSGSSSSRAGSQSPAKTNPPR